MKIFNNSNNNNFTDNSNNNDNNIYEASINQRLTTSMKATNVTKIQIKLFVEESQQLETSI